MEPIERELELSHAIFKEMCFNCGGDITDYRLARKHPCSNCLREPPGEEADLGKVALELRRRGKARGVVEIVETREMVEEFSKFFEKVVGNKPWSAQRTWALRALKGTSFAILAPTGVGKTLFGLVLSLFLALQGKRCYLLFPNSALLVHVYKRLTELARRAGVEESRIVAYYAGLSKGEKEQALQKILWGDYDILLSTPQFLSKHFDKLQRATFDLIFVDDVDSVLKSSRSIDKILQLLGFSREDIGKALELVYTRVRLAAAARRGQLSQDLLDKVGQLEEDVKKAAAKKHGVLLVSTATGRARGLRVRLFRELLGFEVGSRSELLRNIVDAYTVVPKGEVLREVVSLATRLGSGGLIFAPIGTDESVLLELVDKLQARGLRAELMRGKLRKSVLEEFESGKVNVLVGVASYYGLLVRGLDMPHVVKYVLFAGVPCFRFKTDVESLSPIRLIQLAANVAQIASREDKAEIERLVAAIRRVLTTLEPQQYQQLLNSLKQGEVPLKLAGVVKLVRRLQELVRKYLSSEEYLERLSRETAVQLVRENGSLTLVLPDVLTYIQASGRSSRLYAGGISRGISVVVSDDPVLVQKLEKASRYYTGEDGWRPLSEVDLDSLIMEISQERELIRKIVKGEIRPGEIKELLRTALVVVESPTKARTIASFFGRPSKRRFGRYVVYEVSTGGYQLQIVATMGHVFDLATSMYSLDHLEDLYGIVVDPDRKVYLPVFTTIKRCLRCGRQFTDYPVVEKNGKKVVLKQCPYCPSTQILDKVEIVELLRKLAEEVDEVLIATDPDTEGEKIAWDVAMVLKPYANSIKRIEFHEVTRRAFEEALRNPREISINLVRAQLVRRIEDRWIGFALSSKLWKNFRMEWLSAGRVQTPVLGWIISRYEESTKSIRPVFTLELSNSCRVLVENMELNGKKPREICKELEGSEVVVSSLRVAEKELQPPPPFATDTLLREANRVLGFSADYAMKLAQDLFELGLITYHRTDSTRVSDAGLAVARTYITERFGEECFRPRRWGEGGAHECIRPTRPLDVDTLQGMIRQGIVQLPTPLTRDHLALYNLVFRRFMASQMQPAKVEEEQLEVRGLYFRKELTRVKRVVYDGFLKVQPLRDAWAALEPGVYRVVGCSYKRVALVPLFTQADVIQLMKEKNIGRPSTYSEIVKKLLDKYYVIAVKRGKLVPTKLGMQVYSFLADNYGNLVSEEKTSEVLERMDAVESGLVDYKEVLSEFYDEIQQVLRK
uniref:Reverse gyrase n=1 Tax=Thermofilum pendens TaxID=2269 RepID=A0A7C1PBL5_THEPE